MGRVVRLVAVDEQGRRIGEDHPAARLTDDEVDLMRQLREEHGWGWRRLAQKFEVSTQTVRRICRYQRRASITLRFKSAVYLTTNDVVET